MKNQINFAILCLGFAMIFTACAGTPSFEKDVAGKEWKLIEVLTAAKNISFDRKELKSLGFDHIFVIQFDSEQLQGLGAPNSYTGLYARGSELDMEINNVDIVINVPIQEPEKLREQEYFTYLKNVYQWDLKDKRLELHTKNADGEEAVLVYITE